MQFVLLSSGSWGCLGCMTGGTFEFGEDYYYYKGWDPLGAGHLGASRVGKLFLGFFKTLFRFGGGGGIFRYEGGDSLFHFDVISDPLILCKTFLQFVRASIFLILHYNWLVFIWQYTMGA